MSEHTNDDIVNAIMRLLADEPEVARHGHATLILLSNEEARLEICVGGGEVEFDFVIGEEINET